MMTKDEGNKITTAVEEAARLLRENPHWTYKKAIDTANEMTISILEVPNVSPIR